MSLCSFSWSLTPGRLASGARRAPRVFGSGLLRAGNGRERRPAQRFPGFRRDLQGREALERHHVHAGLLVPRTAAPSAVLLMMVMLGAFLTQISHGRNGVGEIVFFVLLGVIAYLRRGPWVGRRTRVAAAV